MNLNDSEQTETNYISDNINMHVNNYKNFNLNDKKQLIKRINEIKNKKCYLKIFKLIHNDNLKYTKNDNGIFFNITNLSNDILTNIDIILSFYESKPISNNIISYNIFTEDSESNK